MRWIRSKTFAVVAATLTTAAVFGGSLGMAFAGVRLAVQQMEFLRQHVSANSRIKRN
mgnify:CR=1 FL=1